MMRRIGDAGDCDGLKDVFISIYLALILSGKVSIRVFLSSNQSPL